MNTVIVDDDLKSRKILYHLLSKHPEINVVGEANSVTAALRVIKEKKPDTLFLDVCLKGKTGFDLVNMLPTHPRIVFISGYDEYAIQAFEINAADYLQKPISKERLAVTVSRLLKENGMNENGKSNGHSNGNGNGSYNGNGNGHGSNNKFNGSNGNGNGHNKEDYDVIDEDDFDEEVQTYIDPEKILDLEDRVFFSSDGISRFIKVGNIVCITAEKDYSYVYTMDNKKYLILKPMVEWEARLTPKHFLRIHRSTIINLEFVDRIEKWFNYSQHVYLIGIDQPFTMSRRYAAKLKDRFK